MLYLVDSLQHTITYTLLCAVWLCCVEQLRNVCYLLREHTERRARHAGMQCRQFSIFEI
jgi:hypothetical protein